MLEERQLWREKSRPKMVGTTTIKLKEKMFTQAKPNILDTSHSQSVGFLCKTYIKTRLAECVDKEKMDNFMLAWGRETTVQKHSYTP